MSDSRALAEEAEVVIRVNDESDLPVVLVRVGEWLKRVGVNPVDRARISTASMELATNIVKYAHRGVLSLRRLEHGAHLGIELEARDSGPGIADVQLALRERYSSSGSLGLGLSGVRRMMDDFDLRSEPGVGTVVRVRRWLS